MLTCEEIATTLDLSPTEIAGPSKIGSLTVRLAMQPDDEPAIKEKQRMLSELKEDARLKLADKHHSETGTFGQRGKDIGGVCGNDSSTTVTRRNPRTGRSGYVSER